MLLVWSGWEKNMKLWHTKDYIWMSHQKYKFSLEYQEFVLYLEISHVI